MRPLLDILQRWKRGKVRGRPAAARPASCTGGAGCPACFSIAPETSSIRPMGPLCPFLRKRERGGLGKACFGGKTALKKHGQNTLKHAKTRLNTPKHTLRFFHRKGVKPQKKRKTVFLCVLCASARKHAFKGVIKGHQIKGVIKGVKPGSNQRSKGSSKGSNRSFAHFMGSSKGSNRSFAHFMGLRGG